jgi:hypothetical protein
MESIAIVAFDQHAATTVAAVLLPRQRTPVLHTLTSEPQTILRFVQRLQRQHPVRCCYEAGPCGFALQRAFTAHGISCELIAPALIPRRPGDRVNPDRRDAGQLAVLYRADALTPSTFRPRSRRPSGICCAVVRTSASICCGRDIGWHAPVVADQSVTPPRVGRPPGQRRAMPQRHVARPVLASSVSQA